MDESSTSNLSKKEKRALAKEGKSKMRASEKRVQSFKNIFYIFLVIGIIVGGIWYLSQSSTKPSASLQTTFTEYAGELGLDEEQFVTFLESDDASKAVDAGLSAGNARGINSTPTFQINDEIIPGPRGYDAFAAILDEALEQNENAEPIALLETDQVKGKENASVTLIEYADFQCPACASYAPVVEQLEENYGDRVRFVFRHFPLISIHKNAYAASVATEAAGAQGKFWEMHDLLFERQSEWSRL